MPQTQTSDLRLEEQRSTLRGDQQTLRETMLHAERPFEKLNNQVILYRCTVCQNHKDGIKRTDYKL